MSGLLLELGPWLLGIIGLVFGLFSHQRAKVVKAEAKQEVAEAHSKIEQANASASQAGADAAKERIHVENNIAARPAGDSTERLRDNWSRD